MDCHFRIKVAVVYSDPALAERFVSAVPGVGAVEGAFGVLRTFEFTIFAGDSLALQIDMWALPPDALERSDAHVLCCDAAVVFYVGRGDEDVLQLVAEWHRKIADANRSCRYVCCSDLSSSAAESVARAGIIDIAGLHSDDISRAFKAAIAGVVSEIPNPPDPLFLMDKNVRIGALLLNDPLYKRALLPKL